MNIATTQDEKQRLNLKMPDGDGKNISATVHEDDLERMRAYLSQGLGGFARQGDIVELHKRIGEKFERLPEELQALNDTAGDDRQAEFEELQASLNSLEGALRIELAPMLQQAITETLQNADPVRGSVRKTLFWVILALVAGTGIGVAFQETILGLLSQAGSLLLAVGGA